MGLSEQLYHLPLPSGADTTAMVVDLRDSDGRALGNSSATLSAGKVVGDSDSITELNEVELFGLKLIAGNPKISWPSTGIDPDLKEPATSKARYGNF